MCSLIAVGAFSAVTMWCKEMYKFFFVAAADDDEGDGKIDTDVGDTPYAPLREDADL